MPERRLVRAFLILWWTLGLMLFVLSVRTVLHATSSAPTGNDVHALLVGGLEAVAAALFLIPRFMRAAGSGLLAIIALAAVVHAADGEFPAPLLIYAAAVYFVVIHGSVPVRPNRPDRGSEIA